MQNNRPVILPHLPFREAAAVNPEGCAPGAAAKGTNRQIACWLAATDRRCQSIPQTPKRNASHAGSVTEEKKGYTTTWVVWLEAIDFSSRLSALSPLVDFDFGKAVVSSSVITSVALLNRSPDRER